MATPTAPGQSMDNEKPEDVKNERDSSPGSVNDEYQQAVPNSMIQADQSQRKWYQKMWDLPEYKFRGSRMTGPTLNWAIAVICGCAFLMFGYDQGVLSALLTLEDFQSAIPLMTPLETSNALCWLDEARTIRDEDQCRGDANTQAAGIAIYQIGCFLGALLILFYGERWGRKRTTFWGSLIMIIGTVFQAATFGYTPFVIGRIIGGIGNGMVTSTVPTWQSECARPHRRGFLLLISGATITCGVMISYWIDYGFFFLEGDIRWRFPLAFQSFFTILVMIGILFLPDSPRWLASRGRVDEARDVTARLLGLPEDNELVTIEVQNIEDALRAQNADGGFKMKELLTNGPSQNLRRTLLGIAAQMMQQLTGINLITYYATFLFENSLGFDQAMSRLLAAANGTEYFLASVVAVPLIERTGRRPLMLFGAFGMMASMAVLAGTVSTGDVDPETGAPVLDTPFAVAATVFLFVFNTFFAIGWLGMTWLYPAEISNLRIRIQANALSTCSNWLSNFLIVMITPPSFDNIGYRTYIIFAVLNAAIIPCVYFFFPEPKGRSLEELDVIFASAHADGVNPVGRSLKMPKLEDNELETALAKYFGEDVENVRRRRSSALATSAQA